jgi:hypothetical protein
LIKDNLARKSVDFRTKMRCYKELKALYGIQRGDNIQKGVKGTLSLNDTSIDGTLMSQDKTAKEVGFSRKIDGFRYLTKI